jgi:hypothetical protein
MDCFNLQAFIYFSRSFKNCLFYKIGSYFHKACFKDKLCSMINTVSKYELFYFRFCKIELQDHLNDILSTIINHFLNLPFAEGVTLLLLGFTAT